MRVDRLGGVSGEYLVPETQTVPSGKVATRSGDTIRSTARPSWDCGTGYTGRK